MLLLCLCSKNVLLYAIIEYMDWQTRRKFIYASSVIVFLIAFSVYIFLEKIVPVPTCFDNKQNNFESGIDCGGSCSLVCSSEVIPLTVLWTRYIKTDNNTYDLVAMISNNNTNNAAKNIAYTFTTYNTKGEIIDTFKGVAITPISSDFPIIRQDVYLEQIPQNVTLTIEDSSHFTVQEKSTSPVVQVRGERYEDGEISRVYATVRNMKRAVVTDLSLRVLLYDQDNNVYAVGKTVLPRLEDEESKEISFTWKNKLPFSPLRIKVYPIVNPFTVTN